MKKTKLTVHIPTGEGKPNTHIQLWNNDSHPDIMFGGVAEVQDINGKKEMRIITTAVETNGATYQNPAEPYIAFINRFPTDEQKKSKAKPYTGNIAKIIIRAQGSDRKSTKDLGVIIFVNDGSRGQFLSGYWNEKGLEYDDKFRVKTDNAGTLRITADVVGGLKEDMLSQMLKSKTKK
jgi:hypothetical protein